MGLVIEVNIFVNVYERLGVADVWRLSCVSNIQSAQVYFLLLLTKMYET